jgi:3-deoxy-D-manno-octulosonate 8-phosphate phosphatase (KDO 8-P phosphatase)
MSAADIHARLLRIKLLAMDVDGVLTDGSLYYTDSGEELKKFNVKDGQGLAALMRHGIEIAIISAGASTATLHRAKRLRIEHVFISVEDKLAILKELTQRLGLSLSQVGYIGDDANDLPVMQAVGFPFTVADAMPKNRACALYVAKLGGGQGAVREICEYLLQYHIGPH